MSLCVMQLPQKYELHSEQLMCTWFFCSAFMHKQQLWSARINVLPCSLWPSSQNLWRPPLDSIVWRNAQMLDTYWRYFVMNKKETIEATRNLSHT